MMILHISDLTRRIELEHEKQKRFYSTKILSFNPAQVLLVQVIQKIQMNHPIQIKTAGLLRT
jgi:hypothetical protein